MFRTPGALSGAWTDPLPPGSPEPKPQPIQRPVLSLAQAHAHAFNTPKGWEAPERSRVTKDLSPPNQDAISRGGSDKPKWMIPYNRYVSEDLPYTLWEAVSPPSSVRGAPRSPVPPSSSRSSISTPGRIPRADGSDISWAARSEPCSSGASSSYRTARRQQTTWKWTQDITVIPDPDYPDGPPPCLSPHPSSVSSRRSAQMKSSCRTNPEDAEGAAIGDENDNGECVMAENYFDLPVVADQIPRRLTVSEVSVFGSVGTVETVWGAKQPECGMCRCEGPRVRYRLHGETCPLHIRSRKWGPAALKGQGDT
ncbi:hypothetical protein FRC04_010971 [Tulasnella sp. 424]|nr:hypothetical protein FRC04_010971 [Tulasnella sp. 424]KAG8972133.1 hypothetical protein FRC05_010301 [Tulasnella sp. 425]